MKQLFRFKDARGMWPRNLIVQCLPCTRMFLWLLYCWNVIWFSLPTAAQRVLLLAALWVVPVSGLEHNLMVWVRTHEIKRKAMKQQIWQRKQLNRYAWYDRDAGEF